MGKRCFRRLEHVPRIACLAGECIHQVERAARETLPLKKLGWHGFEQFREPLVYVGIGKSHGNPSEGEPFDHGPLVVTPRYTDAL